MAAPSHRRRSAWTWLLAAILLLASLVGMLAVPIYARTEPKLGSFPFFYWYQLIWIPGVAVLTWLAYLLVGSGQRDGASQGRAAPPGNPGTRPEAPR
jgi:hypothetical protein